MKIYIIVNGYICKRSQKERLKNGRSETLLSLKKTADQAGIRCESFSCLRMESCFSVKMDFEEPSGEKS